MPTIGTQPSLQSTRAVGAALLHQFARERFSEAGVDHRLLQDAESMNNLDNLASILLDNRSETSVNHDTSSDLNDTSSNDVSQISVQNTSYRTSRDTSDITSSETSQSTLQNSSLDTTQSTIRNMSQITTERGQQALSDNSEYHSMAVNGNNSTMYHSMSSRVIISAFDLVQFTPVMVTYGRELRRLAEEFERSRFRQSIKQKADQVDLTDITKEGFYQLLEELFQDKISGERIVILFFFCTDVALRAMSYAKDLVIKLIGWSFSYIIDRVCNFVHQLGGWDKVLFHQLPSLLMSCTLVLAIISLGVFIKTSLTGLSSK